MRKFLCLLFLVVPLYGFGQDVDNFRLEDINGKSISFDELKGEKLTLLDFWATWCKPCVSSIPKLIALAGEYDSTQVSLVGINIDSPRNLSKVKPFVESLGVNYPILLDINQEVYRDLNITAIPTLLLVNEDNDIIFIHEGFLPGDEISIQEEINKYLNHAPK